MSNKTLEQEIKEYLVHIINPNLHDKDSHINQVLALIKDIDRQARIDEWQPFLTAEVNYGGSPAIFNPEGLPISTPTTRELTKLLRNHAENRLSSLKGGQDVQ